MPDHNDHVNQDATRIEHKEYELIDASESGHIKEEEKALNHMRDETIVKKGTKGSDVPSLEKIDSLFKGKEKDIVDTMSQEDAIVLKLLGQGEEVVFDNLQTHLIKMHKMGIGHKAVEAYVGWVNVKLHAFGSSVQIKLESFKHHKNSCHIIKQDGNDEIVLRDKRGRDKIDF